MLEIVAVGVALIVAAKPALVAALRFDERVQITGGGCAFTSSELFHELGAVLSGEDGR